MTTCEIVAERVALKEPLGEHADHAVSCERCRELVAVADKLGATHHAIDPGLGFSARMTVGAQQRIATRRRRRIATTMGVSAAAAAAMVFVVTRPTDHNTSDPIVAISPIKGSDEPPVAVDDADLRLLVSDPEIAAHTTADWKHITKPLRPYKKLLQGIK